MDGQTVVITGASAGIGRATARLFGERGARVGLIARGQAGLDGAVRDVAEVHPVDGSGGHDHGARGAFDDRSHRRSLQLWLSHHARASSGALAGAATAGALAARLGQHR